MKCAQALDFFGAGKVFSGSSNYSLAAEFLLTPESTGKFIISTTDDPSVQTSLFIFAESEIKKSHLTKIIHFICHSISISI